jgi:hypothetical protein
MKVCVVAFLDVSNLFVEIRTLGYISKDKLTWWNISRTYNFFYDMLFGSNRVRQMDMVIIVGSYGVGIDMMM